MIGRTLTEPAAAAARRGPGRGPGPLRPAPPYTLIFTVIVCPLTTSVSV